MACTVVKWTKKFTLQMGGDNGKRWPAPSDLLYSCYKRLRTTTGKNGASSAPTIECVLVWPPSPDQSPGADRSPLTRRPEAELRINRRMGWAWGWVGELPFRLLTQHDTTPYRYPSVPARAAAPGCFKSTPSDLAILPDTQGPENLKRAVTSVLSEWLAARASLPLLFVF